MTLEDCRGFYAEEVRLLAELDSGALYQAFTRVPRERFCGPPPWQILSPEGGLGGRGYVATSNPADLYHNVLVALDASRGINNGQPSALARWIAALHLSSGARVFHLGCGAGYYTAIMTETVGPAGSVLAVDIDEQLAARAEENLRPYPNVEVRCGDGAAMESGTRDAIFVNAGVTHPQRSWLENLADGGRLVFPLTAGRGAQTGGGVVIAVERSGSLYPAAVIGPVAIYSSVSARDTALEPAIRKALTTGVVGKLKFIRMDEHQREDGCIVHANGVCLSAPV